MHSAFVRRIESRLGRSLLCFSALLSLAAVGRAAAERPNLIVIFCDDLGYGDLGCFGHPTIRTPNLDRLAEQGQRWTEFYVAACVCTPSRAGLLTGRLPIRNGMCSNTRRVLFPDSKGGLPATEITIASMLKQQGYATACVGKWHLGHLPPYLPTSHGFDSYFGIPYSNDMDHRKGAPGYRKLALADANFLDDTKNYQVPLMRNEEIVERPANQLTITKRYGEEASKWIRKFQDKPFFIYLAHNLPHIPLFCSDAFRGKSQRGLYGDVVEEIDSTVGRIVRTLRETGLAEKTLIVFTSDNGPWLTFGTHGGSAGLLRDGKGSTWEGGMREPTIFWWPGHVRPGVVTELGATLDLFPTFAALAGAKIPTDRVYDGGDLSPVLLGSGPSPRDRVFYYHGEELYAVRLGDFKAHFKTKTSYVGKRAKTHEPPLLYNLRHDPSEQYDIGPSHADTIKQIRVVAEEHAQTVQPVENQLIKR